jgi:lipopolysaccharide heptosyltransferase II
MGIDDNSWDSAQNVLCVRLDSIGDVLMSTPAMRAIKESAPGRRTTLLTSPAGARIAGLASEIDDVIVYEAPWLKATSPREDSRPDYAMAELLREADFDAAVIFTVYSQNPLPSAFLCYLAGVPLRLAHCRENPYQLLTHWVPEPEPEQGVRHEVRRQLDLVARVGCRTSDERMRLPVSEGARSRVLGMLGELGVDPQGRWTVVHPGATAPSRRYPALNFAQVARRLAADFGYEVVFTGAGEESQLVAHIQAAMGLPSYSLVNRLDLPELAALLSLAPAVISNNTGPAHIAAAVGTPVVDLYALTNPQHTPWGVRSRVLFHDVPCRYCYKSVCPEGHHNCLRLVAPEAVVGAFIELVEESEALQPALEGIG